MPVDFASIAAVAGLFGAVALVGWLVNRVGR